MVVRIERQGLGGDSIRNSSALPYQAEVIFWSNVFAFKFFDEGA